MTSPKKVCTGGYNLLCCWEHSLLVGSPIHVRIWQTGQWVEARQSAIGPPGWRLGTGLMTLSRDIKEIIYISQIQLCPSSSIGI